MEEYFYDYNVNKTHRLHSCTKSVVSLLIGKALEERKFPALETSLEQLFPNYTIKKNLKKINLEEILSMTSGFGRLEVDLNSDNDWKQALFSKKPLSKAGKKFRYDDNNSYLLGELLEEAVEEPIDQYAKEKLFTLLDINDYHWEKVNGKPTANTGLSLRARDLLKIGCIVSDNGKWQGNQIISSEWIKESTCPQINAVDYLDYGFHWWNIQGKEFEFEQNIPLAQGAGGQRLIIIPELDIICVVFGGNFDIWNSIEKDIWKIIIN